MDTKPWYKSKIVWAMALQALISILFQVQEWYAKGDFSVPAWIGLIIAGLVIVLRVFFTSTVIGGAIARVDPGDHDEAEAASKLEMVKADNYHMTIDQRS